ncbi:hypothetical protein [Aphanizomenon flos-aquae]|uniref:hypothetical protein n=1 Tax=Aphanizomenon flos-aquae TaxID=1176 RepID=UPI0012697D6E|nr:hypothetical protein [Aphanizomenon flos-aquae]
MARQKALMQEVRVKRVWAILHFFTQFGFIVFTYLTLKFNDSYEVPCNSELFAAALCDRNF